MDKVIAASLTLDASQANKSVKEFKNDLKQAENDYKILRDTVGETNAATIAAAENINKIKQQINQAAESMKSFKTRVREAEQNLITIQQTFGATSKEALEAAKGVAQMKDQMKEAREVSDLFDPGAKYQVFGNVLRTVAGGFSALTGTMALFGAESEEVEKSILKVQAALAITEGVNTIVDSAKDFDRLKAVILQTTVVQKVYSTSTALANTVTKALGISTAATSVGFKVLRGAIIATGIGALVVAIGLLITNFDKVKQVVMNLIPGLSGVADTIGNIINRVTDFIGVTSEAGRQSAKMIKELQGEIKANEQFLDLNADKYDQYTMRKIQADQDYKKKKLEFLQDDELTEGKKNALIKAAEDQRTRLIQSASTERAAAEKKIRDDANKKLSDDANRLAEEQKARTEQAAAELRSIQQENYLASITDQRKQAEEKVRIDYENSVRELSSLMVSDDLKTNLLKENETKRQLALKQVKIDFDAKDIEDEKKKNDDIDSKLKEQYARQLEIIKQEELKISNALKEDVLDGTVSPEDAALAELEIKRTALQAEYDLNAAFGYSNLELKSELLAMDVDASKKAKDEKLAIDEAERVSKMSLYSSIASGFGALSNLFKQGTKAAKAAALAEIAINTGIGYMNGLVIAQATSKALGPAGAFVFPAFYASQIAAVLGAAARAKSILSSGTSGGTSAPSIPNVSAGAPAPLSPPRPQETSTRLPQDQINQIGEFSTRAYVLEADVSNSQSRNAMINRQARLGG